ncbi:MAG: hypothetical protein IJF27_05220 [Oscillospiraceae bacterium]|nr:hypothetical protein [Oscillospiraceae bacterium]MBQ3049140.1 hypothetical protein [Oscillospiraceae bacterium]
MNCTISRIVNYVAIPLMAVVLVLTFLPSLTYGGETLSVQTLAWLPLEHKDFVKAIEEFFGYEELDLNAFVTFPLLQMIAGVVGGILCAKNGANPFVSLIPCAFGVLGVLGYFSNEVLASSSYAVISLVICIVVAVISLASAVIGIIQCERVA